jgi:hypothetical protein
VVSQPVDRNRPEALLALLEIGRAMRAGGDLQPVLAAVASAVRRATGFGTVVINLHRPAGTTSRSSSSRAATRPARC